MTTWIKEKQIIEELERHFRCEWRGYHGINHWSRVQKNGLLLAEKEKTRKDVVTLFSLFHDSARENEGYDIEHGIRGIHVLDKFKGVYFDIDDKGYYEVKEAIVGHSNGYTTHQSIHVKVCWDADRLDLARVGIEPLPQHLCTSTARQQSFIDEAIKRSFTLIDFEFPKFTPLKPKI